jgi:tetratricopeptide (TPR) repeat protein
VDQGAGQKSRPKQAAGKFARQGNIMSDLKHLLEFKNGEFRSDMFASPSVCAAYKVLLGGDHVAAEQRFRRILQDDNMDHEAIAGLAVCVAEDGGKFVTAEKLARKAIRISKKSAAGYIALGYINLRGARLDEGYQYLMKAKHLAPRDPRLEQGFAMYDQERPPVISDLSRLHPVNQALSGARAYMRSPYHKAMALTAIVSGLYLTSSVLS